MSTATRNPGTEPEDRVGAITPGLTVATLCLLVTVGAVPPNAAGAEPVVRVGVVLDGNTERDDLLAAAFRKEIDALLEGEFRVVPKLVEADWTVEGVTEALDAMLLDPEIDVVIAAGLTASSVAIQRRDLSKPVVAPFVIDGHLQGAPLQGDASGVHNLAYATFPPTLLDDIGVFRELVSFDRVLALRAPVPQVTRTILDRQGAEIERRLGVTIEILEAPPTAAEILARLPAHVDAVLVGALLNVSDDEMRQLAAGLSQRGIPSFAFFPGDVALGILASNQEPADVGRLGRRVAILLQRILLGEEAGSLPVTFDRRSGLTINMETARAIGVTPSFALEADAELLHPQREKMGQRLSLPAVIALALDRNLDLLAKADNVSAGEKAVRQSKANLLPQLELGAAGALIDADRSSLLQAERTLLASASLRQVIYSDRVVANATIENRLQISRAQELRQLRLDVAQQAAAAYLNVLRAKTFEWITRRNLSLTRENLDRARARVRTGMADRSEVLRWESEHAQNLRDVIEAIATRNVAELEVNRVLGYPIEAPFITEEVGLDAPELITSDERLYHYLRDRNVFRVFRTMNVREALELSPELAQLDAGILAQERVLDAARRSFYIPDAFLEARVDHRLYEAGAGSEEPRPWNAWDWQVGVQATLPLFSGGARAAERAGAQLELSSLRRQRAALAQRIEQRARASHHVLGASFAGIRLARQSADAAREGFELVSDAYTRGAVSIIEVLDAQRTFVVAELAAANARYEFLLDLVNAERAIGRFTLTTPAERDAYFERLAAFEAEQAAQEAE